MIIENVFTIAPIAMLDVPMATDKFANEDGTYKTIREYCDTTTAKWRESNDGRYMLFGHEFSDLANDFTTAKRFAVEIGLRLGGSDFTQTEDGLVWILSYSEVLRFLDVSPMFKEAEPE